MYSEVLYLNIYLYTYISCDSSHKCLGCLSNGNLENAKPIYAT